MTRTENWPATFAQRFRLLAARTILMTLAAAVLATLVSWPIYGELRWPLLLIWLPGFLAGGLIIAAIVASRAKPGRPVPWRKTKR